MEVAVRQRIHRLRGPMLLRCYQVDGAEVDALDTDGWFSTGDAGSLGHRTSPRDRTSRAELGSHRQENVWPEPDGRILRGDPRIADVAVVGRPSAEWGSNSSAVIRTHGTRAPSACEELRDLW
ncbi:MAG: hypothetical protein R2705_20405 [Ilumatobacteraceae bacterium]